MDTLNFERGSDPTASDMLIDLGLHLIAASHPGTTAEQSAFLLRRMANAHPRPENPSKRAGG